MASNGRQQSVYLSAEVLAELHREARRQDRSMSWLVQRAWKIACHEIRAAALPAEEK